MNTSDTSEGIIQPMGLGLSLLCFGIPAVMVVVAFYVVTPALAYRGMMPFYAQLVPVCAVLASLLIASIVAYRSEGRRLTWAGLQKRFRLHRLSGRAWLLAVGATAVGLAGSALGSLLGDWLIESGIMPMPSSLPSWLDPQASISVAERLNQMTGGLRGNWLALLMSAVYFFFNIIGEESWWRGYILPRQELSFGKWTWLIHGVLWVFFHVSRWWDMIGLLPAQMVFVYVVWRSKNTTIAILMHMLSNVSTVIFVLLGVLGLFPV
jgi:membrane protease YdiL (CAAX protease family)